MTPKLTKGQALILVGPQGSGRTLLAQKLAKPHGSFIELNVAELGHSNNFAALLQRKFKTWIIDGLPRGELTQYRIKSHLAQPEPNTPNFIFCTHDPIDLDPADRRFTITRMEDIK